MNQQPESFEPVPAPAPLEPEWLRQPPTPEAFLDAAKKGLGRAVLWLKRFDPKPFLPSVIEVSTKWLGWDYQCNGSIAGYLLELADLSGDPDTCALATFHAAVGDHDRATAWHLDDLLYTWHQRGHRGARAAIDAFFASQLRQGGSVGGNTIIMIDGYEGLKQAARGAGDHLKLDEWFWPEGWIVTCREDAGVEDAEERLRADAAGDPALSAYIAMVDADAERHRNNAKASDSRRKCTLAEVMAMVDDPMVKRADRFHAAYDWAAHAPEAEWIEGARLLLESENPEVPVTLRRAFIGRHGTHKFRPFPLGTEALAARVDDPMPERQRIVRWILACHEGEIARRTALQLLEKGDSRDEVLRMLRSTLLESDMPLVMRVLSAAQSARTESVHEHARDVLLLSEATDAAWLRPAILWAYEHTPCVMCREWAVREMLCIGDLPPEIAREAAYDASLDTREMAIKGLNAEAQESGGMLDVRRRRGR